MISRKLQMLTLGLLCMCMHGKAQSLHFSQYYNTPMLLNPANTGMMPDNDYRIGGNYRNQWSLLPVPYSSMSLFADTKIGAGRESRTGLTKANWLGLGGAVYNDKAGTGELSLLKIQGSAAYHLHMGNTMLLSVGFTGAYVQRSVNLNKLTFDAQWDGYTFNSRYNSNEPGNDLKTTYTTIGVGANWSYYPSDAVYIKLGASAQNINKPVETFYKNGNNTIGMRTNAQLDMLFQASKSVIINPSVYYAGQQGATEIVGGALLRYNMDKSDQQVSQLLLGGYYRAGDAVIGVAGYQLNGIQFMASYDFTTSLLAPYNASYGALELSVIYGGSYYKSGVTKMFTCPRFN